MENLKSSKIIFEEFTFCDYEAIELLLWKTN